MRRKNYIIFQYKMQGRQVQKPPSSNSISQSGQISTIHNQSNLRVGTQLEIFDSVQSDIIRPRSVNTFHRNLTTKNDRKKTVNLHTGDLNSRVQSGSQQNRYRQFTTINEKYRPQTSMQKRDNPHEAWNELAISKPKKRWHDTPKFPEETVSFNGKVRSQESRDKEPMTVAHPELYQIASINTQSIPHQKMKKKGIFESRNQSIQSKPRIIDATMTAYKLLESAFINQAGNPNNLQEKFNAKKLSQKTVYKEVFGQRSKSRLKIKHQTINFQPKLLSPKNVFSPKSVQVDDPMIISPKSVQTEQPMIKKFTQGIESEANSDIRSPKFESTLKSGMFFMPTLIKSSQTTAKQQNQESTVQDLSDVIREQGPAKIRKQVRISRKKSKKQGLLSRIQIEKSNQLNEKLYKMLETVTQQRDQLEALKNANTQNLPIFSSNHIQNLTINAQNGLNFEQIAQLSHLTQQLSQIQNQINNARFNDPIDMFSFPPDQTETTSPLNDRDEDLSQNKTNLKTVQKSSIIHKIDDDSKLSSLEPLKEEKKIASQAKRQLRIKKTVEEVKNFTQKTNFRKFRSLDSSQQKKRGISKPTSILNTESKKQTTESKYSMSKSPVSGMTQVLLALGDRDSTLSKNYCNSVNSTQKNSKLKPNQQDFTSFLMPPGSKHAIKQLPNLSKQNSLITDAKQNNLKYNEDFKLIRAQTHNSNKAANDRDTSSSLGLVSQPSKGSQPQKQSLTKIKPMFCVTNLSTNQKKVQSKVHLKKRKSFKKRADTFEQDKIESAIKPPTVLERYGNKLTKYGHNGSPSQSKIEQSLKISQNLSNSNRRADFENQNQTNEKLVEILLKKIQEIKEMSENISQSAEKSDIKEIMKKMIDDMSEAEMSKMLNASIEEKKFNLDLEENLRIKPEMSSTSSVVTKSIEMPQLQLNKLDSTKSQTRSKNLIAWQNSKIDGLKNVESQQNNENGQLCVIPKISEDHLLVKQSVHSFVGNSKSTSSIIIGQSLGSQMNHLASKKVTMKVDNSLSSSSSNSLSSSDPIAPVKKIKLTSSRSSSSDPLSPKLKIQEQRLSDEKKDDTLLELLVDQSSKEQTTQLQKFLLAPDLQVTNLTIDIQDNDIKQINKDVFIKPELKKFVTMWEHSFGNVDQEFRKMQTNPDFEEDTSQMLKKYGGTVVKETALEKIIFFISQHQVEPSNFDKPLNQSFDFKVLENNEKSYLSSMTKNSQNKFTLKTAKQGTPIALFKKNLKGNIKAQARLLKMEQKFMDPEEIKKMKVLNIIEDLQENYDIHHQELIKIQNYREKTFKLHDLKFSNLMNEISNGGGSRIVFNTDFTNTEPEHKLVEIYDLKIAGMIDHKVKQKFLKNKQFIQQMLMQESDDRTIQKLYEQKIINKNPFTSNNFLMNSINNNILMQLAGSLIKQEDKQEIQSCIDCITDPTTDQLSLLEKYGFCLQDLEQELKIKLNKNNTNLQWYKNNRSLKLIKLQMDQADEDRYESYMKYIDHVWKNKNNKPAFINTQDTSILDSMTSNCNVNLRAVKLMTQTLKIQDQLDWPLIEESLCTYEIKYQFYNFFSNHRRSKKKFFINLDLLIANNFNVKNDIYNTGIKLDEHYQVYQKPNQDCMLLIQNKFNQTWDSRQSAVQFNSLITVVGQNVMNYCKNQMLDQSFNPILKQMNFGQQHNSIEHNQNKVQTRLELENMPSSFNQYTAFHLIQAQQNFHQILFMHKLNSLFENLYDTDQDYELLNLIDQIFNNQKSQFFTKFKALQSKDPTLLTSQEFDQLCHMENTITIFENVNQQKFVDQPSQSDQESPEKILQKQFGDEYDLDISQISQQIGRVSQLQNEKTLYSQEKDFFLRQNALDKFNKDSIEFHILNNLDQAQNKVKKKVSLFYTRVEPILNLNDPHLNALCKIFSYKCTLIRDNNNKYIMEIFKPIPTSKGITNVKLKEDHLRNPRNFKEFQDVQKQLRLNQKKPQRDKIFSALQVEELHTDGSMENVGLSDIQSEDDQMSDYIDQDGCRNKQTQYKCSKNKRSKTNTDVSNLASMQTPIQHYNKLKKERENSKIFSKESQSLKSITLLNQMAESMKPRQNVYRVQTQEEVVDSEQKLTNFFQHIKNKNQINEIVNEIQRGVEKDNKQHIQQLRKQKIEIQNYRELATSKFNKYNVLNSQSKQKERLSSSNNSSQNDSSEITTPLEKPILKKQKTNLIMIEKVRQENIKVKSQALNNSRRKHIKINDSIEMNIISDTELNRLQSKEHNLKKAQSMMEIPRKKYNIEVMPLNVKQDNNQFQGPIKDLLAVFNRNQNHKVQQKEAQSPDIISKFNLDKQLSIPVHHSISPPNNHGHDHSNGYLHSDNSPIHSLTSHSPPLSYHKLDLLAVPGIGSYKTFLEPPNKRTLFAKRTNNKSQSNDHYEYNFKTKQHNKSESSRNYNKSEDSNGLLEHLSKQNTNKMRAGSSSSEEDSNSSQKQAIKSAGIKDIMKKLQLGIKKKIENNLNLLQQEKQTQLKHHHHHHDHDHDHDQEEDSASDLDIGKELEILQEIKDYKTSKKMLKLRQLKKRDLLFNNLETNTNKIKVSSAVKQINTAQKVGFDEHKVDMLKKLRDHFGKRNKLIIITDQKNLQKQSKLKLINAKAIYESRTELFNQQVNQFNQMFKGMINEKIDQQSNISEQKVLKNKIEQPKMELNLTTGSQQVREDNNHLMIKPVQVEMIEKEQSINDKIRTSDMEKQTLMFTTRMHMAILTRNTSLMEDILKRYQGNIDIVKDEAGNCLLIMAALNGDFQMCETLLIRGVDVDAQNHLGNTALHYAIMKKFYKTIDTLISYDVNENIENQDGLLPWQMA